MLGITKHTMGRNQKEAMIWFTIAPPVQRKHDKSLNRWFRQEVGIDFQLGTNTAAHAVDMRKKKGSRLYHPSIIISLAEIELQIAPCA